MGWADDPLVKTPAAGAAAAPAADGWGNDPLVRTPTAGGDGIPTETVKAGMPDLGVLPGKLNLNAAIAPKVPAGAPRPFAPGEWVDNPDGKWSSEITSTVSDPALNGGRATVIPTLWLVGGKPVRVDEDTAAQYAAQSGLAFQSYANEAEAEAASVKREADWQGLKPQEAGKVKPLWVDYSGWDTPSAPTTETVPLKNDPGKTYGQILPYAKDNTTGETEWAVPEMIRAPVRGVVEGGQEARGVRPANDPEARSDIFAAASLGAGSAPGATVKSVTATGPDPSFRPLYELVSRISGGDISKNPGALRIVRRMEQDARAGGKTSAQDILDLLATMPGKPLFLADVAGENNLALAGKAARMPGESRQIMTDALDTRDRGAGIRLDSDVGVALGDEAPTDDAFEALKAARSAAARPLFEKSHAGGSIAPLERQFTLAFDQASKVEKEAFQTLSDALTQLTAARAKKPVTGGNVYSESAANQAVREAEAAVQDARAGLSGAQQVKQQVLDVLRQAQEDGAMGKPGAVWNPRIQQFLDNPRIKQGIRRGLRIERDRALAENRPMNPSEYAIVGEDANGEPIIGKVPTMRLLAVAKEGLDRMLQSKQFANELTGELNKEGVAIDMVRGEFLNELDAINPDYAAARAQWGGDTESLKAFKLGENLFTKPVREINAAVAKMSPSNIEFLRLGAARMLRDNVAGKGIGGDEAKAIITSQRTRNQLRPLFQDDASYDRFIKSVEAEGRMFLTRYNTTGNSKTAARTLEDVSPELQAVAHGARGLSSAASQHWWGAASNLVRAYLSARQLQDPAIYAEVARFETVDLSGKDVAGRLAELRKFLEAMPKTATNRQDYADPAMRLMMPGSVGMALDPRSRAGRNMGIPPQPSIFPP